MSVEMVENLRGGWLATLRDLIGEAVMMREKRCRGGGTIGECSQNSERKFRLEGAGDECN